MDSDEEDFEYSDEDLDSVASTEGRNSSPTLSHQAPNPQSYQVLDLKKLEHRQTVVIAETCELLSLDEDTVTCLFLLFAWNKEKLVERYYSNPSEALESAGIHFNLKYSGPVSGKTFVCPVLFEEFEYSDTFALGCVSKDYPDPEDHRFSKEAWREYLKTQVGEGGSCVRTVCQRENCKCIVPPSVWKFLLTNTKNPKLIEAYKRYRMFLLNSYVDFRKNVKWCPTPGCDIAIEVPAKEVVKVVCCSNCSNKFCFSCNKPDHIPISCKLLEIWEEKCQNESETANWILAHTKSCPICNVRIEKNQGCNHMTCQKCKHHFCWICMNPWEAHGNNTGGFYSCNKYQGKTDASIQNDKDRAKQELEKYLHYYKRFALHDQSLKYAKRQLAKAKLKMEEIQEKHGIGWVEVQYLGEAVSQLIENRRMLMFSYALAYYLPDGSGKSILEDNQSLLERYTENLSELTEKVFEELDKGLINNQSLVTKKFLARIAKAVETEELNDKALANYYSSRKPAKA